MLILSSLLLVLLFFVKSKYSFLLISPIYFFIFIYLVVFCIGWFLYPLDYSYGGVGAHIFLRGDEALNTLKYGLIIIISFSIGTLINQKRHKKIQARFALLKNTNNNISKTIKNTIVFLSLFSLLAIIVGAGISNLWSRTIYINIDVHELKILGDALAPLCFVSMGYLSAFSKIKLKIIIYTIICIFMIVYFSLASRWLALIPLLFSFGVYAAKPHHKHSKYLIVFNFFIAFYLISLPLSLRTLPEQGLAPFIYNLFYNSEFLHAYSFTSILNNFFISFPLTGYVAHYKELEISDLFISINPFPGSLVGWYDISERLRINLYTPFNTPGQLLNHGLFITVLFYIVLGLYFSHIEQNIRKLLSNKKIIMGALFVGMSILYSVYSTQYNLRSSTRLLYYMIAFEILFSIFNKLKLKHKNHSV